MARALAYQLAARVGSQGSTPGAAIGSVAEGASREPCAEAGQEVHEQVAVMSEQGRVGWRRAVPDWPAGRPKDNGHNHPLRAAQHVPCQLTCSSSTWACWLK